MKSQNLKLRSNIRKTRKPAVMKKRGLRISLKTKFNLLAKKVRITNSRLKDLLLKT